MFRSVYRSLLVEYKLACAKKSYQSLKSLDLQKEDSGYNTPVVLANGGDINGMVPAMA